MSLYSFLLTRSCGLQGGSDNETLYVYISPLLTMSHYRKQICGMIGQPT